MAKMSFYSSFRVNSKNVFMVLFLLNSPVTLNRGKKWMIELIDGWIKQSHKFSPHVASALPLLLDKSNVVVAKKQTVLILSTWSSLTPSKGNVGEAKSWRLLKHKNAVVYAQPGQNSKGQLKFSPTNSKTLYARFFISLGEMVSRQIIIIIILIIVICRTLTIETNESGFLHNTIFTIIMSF